MAFPSVPSNMFWLSFWVLASKLKSKFPPVYQRCFRFSLSCHSRFIQPLFTAQFQSQFPGICYSSAPFLYVFCCFVNKLPQTQHIFSHGFWGSVWLSWICLQSHTTAFKVSARLLSHLEAQLGKNLLSSSFRLLVELVYCSRRQRLLTGYQLEVLGFAVASWHVIFSIDNPHVAFDFKTDKRMSQSS